MVATAERFYAGQHGLILLVINSKRIQSEVKYEAGTDKPDELFPTFTGRSTSMPSRVSWTLSLIPPDIGLCLPL